MYMSTNVDIFNESIGYEIFFIKNSLKELNRENYVHYRLEISFENHNYKAHLMNFSDSFGSNLIPSYIKENLIPLVFTSSFKILDMFFEYIIKMNLVNCPWKFSAKLKLLDDNLSNYQRPTIIEMVELNAIYFLYKNLTKFRNKLIHGAWGEICDDKMVFEVDGNKYEIKFEQVFALANVSLLIFRMINSENNSNFIKA